MCVITPWHSSNTMLIPHLLVMESMVIHRQGTVAMTGRAHCQRQVAFFNLSNQANRKNELLVNCRCELIGHTLF